MAPSAASSTTGHTDVAWPSARTSAYAIAEPLSPGQVELHDCLGLALAEPVAALTDLPAFDTVSMDGWAVSDDEGPWQLVEGLALAGHQVPPIRPGEAIETATGAALPAGAYAVLRREFGVLDSGQLTRGPAMAALKAQADVRPRGEEATEGSRVLGSGASLTPPMLGLAAAAGHDTLVVRPAPTVDVFIMGDELLLAGQSGNGRLRDSLRPQAAGWLAAVGATAGTIRHLADTAEETMHALRTSSADLVITTGGTARGPVDQLHPALAAAHAELVVDQVAVRPGHPMVLARLPDGRPVVGLPGNPLAAAVAFLTLAWPVVERMRGLPLTMPATAAVLGEVSAPPHAHRLMPSLGGSTGVQPVLHHGPAMLSGLAAADCLAIIPPGGATTGHVVEVLTLPW